MKKFNFNLIFWFCSFGNSKTADFPRVECLAPTPRSFFSFSLIFRHCLASFGTLWQLLATYGTFWHLMAPFSSLRHLMAPYGTFWHLLAPFGTLWHLMAPFSNLRHLLATYGTFWHRCQHTKTSNR